jgi:hypothetical protein
MLARNGLRFFIAALLAANCGANAASAHEEKIENPNPDRTWGRTVGGMFREGKSVAVVIGISKYIGEENGGYPPLSTAASDVDKMVKFLRDDAGFDTIYVLTDEDATKEKINALMMDDIPVAVGQFDRFLFYWSGHGDHYITRKKLDEGFLPVFDSKRDKVSTMVDMTDIARWNDHLDAQQALFVLDACLSGLAGMEKKGVSDTLALAKQWSLPSRELVTAGTGEETVIASDRWTGSLFTDSFIKGAKGEAVKGEAEQSGIVSLYGLLDYIRRRVTIEKQKVNWNKSLTPQYRQLNDEDGDFFFTPKTGAVSASPPATIIPAHVLEAKGSEAPMVDPLIVALAVAPDDLSRGMIASLLGHVGEKAAPAVEPLIASVLATQDDVTRRTIASALGQIGEKAAPALIAAAQATQDEATRGTIAIALGQIGEKTTLSEDSLIVALESAQDDATRGTIASLLGREKAASAVEPLIAALKATQNDATRGTIAIALGQIGEKAAPAVEPLIAALKATQDFAVKKRIADAAYAIGGPTSQPILAELQVAADKEAPQPTPPKGAAGVSAEQAILAMQQQMQKDNAETQNAMTRMNQQAERDKTKLDAEKTRHDIVMGIAGNIK